MKENKVGFGLSRIKTEQFAIIENACIENEEVQLGAGIGYELEDETKIASCIVRFEFRMQQTPFLLISVRCEFYIDDEAWADFTCAGKKSVCLPKGFASHLAVVTVGTARGVLHAKTENTKYNEYFLPTINVTEIVTDDIVFELAEKNEQQQLAYVEFVKEVSVARQPKPTYPWINKIENNTKEARISTLQKIIELGLGGHLELSIKL